MNTKSIAYAYATSVTAERLGWPADGCWFVQTFDGRTKVASEGFAAPDSDGLIAAYHATAGVHCPHFLRHGCPAALAGVFAAEGMPGALLDAIDESERAFDYL